MKEEDIENVADVFITVFTEEGEDWTKQSALKHLEQKLGQKIPAG